MQIVVYASMTFYFRSLLPVISELVKNGNTVYVIDGQNGLKSFNAKRIKKKPKAFNVINESSLKFICRQIGLEDTFVEKLKFIPAFLFKNNLLFSKFYKQTDLFLSTVKNFHWLNSVQKYNKPRLALPYQNFFSCYYSTDNKLFDTPYFYADIDFEEKYKRNAVVESIQTGFPYMDKYFEKSKQKHKRKNQVLLLHAGGYRNVITEYNENKQNSYNKQLNLYRKILEYLPNNYKLAVKIHPLAARFHDVQAHQEMKQEVDIEVVEGFLGDLMFDYEAILSLGSSSAYEILPFNIPFWILNFGIKKERTNYYKALSSLFVETGEDLKEKLEHKTQASLNTPFENKFVLELKNTIDGNSTKKIMKIIETIC